MLIVVGLVIQNLTASPISYHSTSNPSALTNQPQLETGKYLSYEPSYTGNGDASQWPLDSTKDGATVFHSQFSERDMNAWQDPAQDQPSIGAGTLELGIQ